MLSDAEAEAARESRKHLAQMRCQCGECEPKDVRACETCDGFEPRCLLANVREYVECAACEEKRAAEMFRDFETIGRVELLARDHFPGKVYEGKE